MFTMMTQQGTPRRRLLTALPTALLLFSLLMSYIGQVWCSEKCPPHCTDGCHGTSNKDCNNNIPCKNYILGTACVDKCPRDHYVQREHHGIEIPTTQHIITTSQPHRHDVSTHSSVTLEAPILHTSEKTDRNSPHDSTQSSVSYTVHNLSLRDVNAVNQSDADSPSSDVADNEGDFNSHNTIQQVNQSSNETDDQPVTFSYDICQPCHEECDSCHGPSPSDCNRCRRTKYKNDCIPKCPSWTLEFKGVCYLCVDECEKCKRVKPYDCKYCKVVFNDTCMEECPPDSGPVSCQTIGAAAVKDGHHKYLSIIAIASGGLFIAIVVISIICFTSRYCGCSRQYYIPSVTADVRFENLENSQTPDILRKDPLDLENGGKKDEDETEKSGDGDGSTEIKDETEKSGDDGGDDRSSEITDKTDKSGDDDGSTEIKDETEKSGDSIKDEHHVTKCDGGSEMKNETELEPEYNTEPDGFGGLLTKQEIKNESDPNHELEEQPQRLLMKCLELTEDGKRCDGDASFPQLFTGLPTHSDVPLGHRAAPDVPMCSVYGVKESDSAYSSLTKHEAGHVDSSPDLIYLDVSSKHAANEPMAFVNNGIDVAVSENDSDIGSMYSFVSGNEVDSGLGSSYATINREDISSVCGSVLCVQSDSTTIEMENRSDQSRKDNSSTLADSACDLSYNTLNKRASRNAILNQTHNFIPPQKRNDKRKFYSLPKFHSTAPKRRPRIRSFNVPIEEFPFIISKPCLESRPLLQAGDKDEGASASISLHEEKPAKMENQTRKKIQELLKKFRDSVAKNGASNYYSNDVFAAAVIGTTGGNMSIAAMDVHLYVPPGSLDHDESIYIYVEDSLHGDVQLEDGKTVLTPTVYCGPIGVKFNRPVVLTTPHCAARLSGWNADVYKTESEGEDDARWNLVPNNEIMRVVKKTNMVMFPTHFTGFKAGAAEDKWMKIFIIGNELKRGDSCYPFDVKMCNKLAADIKSILDEAAESGNKKLKSNEMIISDIKNEGITMMVDQVQDGWTVRGHASKTIPYQYVWSSEHFGSTTKVPYCSFRLDLVDPSSPVASRLVSGDVHTFQESKRDLGVELQLHSEIRQREKESYQRSVDPTSIRRALDTNSIPDGACFASDTNPIPDGACFAPDTPGTRFLFQQYELTPTPMIGQFLSDHISREVCVLLDEKKADGTDWRMLAQELEVNDQITYLDQKQCNGESPSRCLVHFFFAEQCREQPSPKVEDVVRKLITILHKLNKGEAANVLDIYLTELTNADTS